MTSPEYRIDCLTCGATGQIGAKCPYPADFDPECDHCSIPCVDHEECPTCEGKGWLSPDEQRSIMEDERCEC